MARIQIPGQPANSAHEVFSFKQEIVMPDGNVEYLSSISEVFTQFFSINRMHLADSSKDGSVTLFDVHTEDGKFFMISMIVHADMTHLLMQTLLGYRLIDYYNGRSNKWTLLPKRGPVTKFEFNTKSRGLIDKHYQPMPSGYLRKMSASQLFALDQEKGKSLTSLIESQDVSWMA